MIREYRCAECAASKCVNCTGWALDDADAFTDCECECRDATPSFGHEWWADYGWCHIRIRALNVDEANENAKQVYGEYPKSLHPVELS